MSSRPEEPTPSTGSLIRTQPRADEAPASRRVIERVASRVRTEIVAVLADDRLESLPVSVDQHVTWDADTVNPLPAPP
jgi:hypothetical protein